LEIFPEPGLLFNNGPGFVYKNVTEKRCGSFQRKFSNETVPLVVFIRNMLFIQDVSTNIIAAIVVLNRVSVR